MRLRHTILVLSAAGVLASCGSTAQFAGSQGLPGSGGLDTPAVSGEGAAQDVLGAGTGGPTDVEGPAALPGDPEFGGGGFSPGGAVPPDGSQVVAPGSASKSPIQIGVLIVNTDDFKNATGTGPTSGPSYTSVYRESMHAYLKAINDGGGVAGRKLSVVDFEFTYAAASYDTEFQAACQKFTKDNRVGAVIYDATVYNQSFNTCLTKAGVPLFYMGQTGTQVGDRTDFANHPGMITMASANVDRRVRSVLNKAIASGFLRAGSKLGVFVENCPYNQRAYDRTFAPIVARNKIAVVRLDVDCGSGASDQGTGSAAVGSAALRFRSEGVDSVMFHSNFENGLWFYFATTAEQQQYRPQYLLFHNQGCPGCLAAGRSAGLQGQFAGLKGFGGLPLGEITHPPAPPAAQAAARRACVATAKRQGVAYDPAVHLTVVFDACDAVGLLHRTLTLSGGQAGTRAVVGALERLGTDFVSTMTLTGVTRFGPGRRDGLELTAVSVYQAKCGCVAYITKPSPIT